jgi:hypothetical protein
MQPARSLLLYLAIILVAGALLAPWLYWLAHSLAGHLPGLDRATREPFYRYVTRAMLLVALAGLWPMLRLLGVHSWSAAGLVPGVQWRRLGLGFALGFGSLALLAALAVGCGARDWRSGMGGRLATELAGVTLTAAIVSIVEEVIFRGAIFNALKRAYSLRAALWGSSGLYALSHFLQRTEQPQTIEWHTGLTVLARMLGGLADPMLLVPGFLTLALAGLILALALHRTGALYLSIGLHAGWIFWQKAYNLLTRPAADAAPGFWGTNRLYDGWLAFLVLAAVLALMWFRPTATRAAHAG